MLHSLTSSPYFLPLLCSPCPVLLMPVSSPLWAREGSRPRVSSLRVLSSFLGCCALCFVTGIFRPFFLTRSRLRGGHWGLAGRRPFFPRPRSRLFLISFAIFHWLEFRPECSASPPPLSGNTGHDLLRNASFSYTCRL